MIGQCCQDSDEVAEVCLNVFTHLSCDDKLVATLTPHNTQSLVCACMSAYPAHLPIQALACHFLLNVSRDWRCNDSSGKAPVREAALELLARALKQHGGDARLVHDALQTVLHVLHSSERDALASDVTERTQSTIFVMSFVQTEILPIALLLAQVSRQDARVTSLCNKLMTFFTHRDDADSEYDLLRDEKMVVASLDIVSDGREYESIELLDE